MFRLKVKPDLQQLIWNCYSICSYSPGIVYNALYFSFSLGICTFKKNLCDWTNTFDDDGEWHLHHDETPSFETGPHYDSDGNGRNIMHFFSIITGKGVEGIVLPLFNYTVVKREKRHCNNLAGFKSSCSLLMPASILLSVTINDLASTPSVSIKESFRIDVHFDNNNCNFFALLNKNDITIWTIKRGTVTCLFDFHFSLKRRKVY